MLNAYIAVLQDHFFGNNSGKLEPIGTKFYRETSAQVELSPANFWCPVPNGHKIAKNQQTSLVTITTPRFTHFLAADLYEL